MGLRQLPYGRDMRQLALTAEGSLNVSNAIGLSTISTISTVSRTPYISSMRPLGGVNLQGSKPSDRCADTCEEV